jgi:hypothetical protein
MRWSLSRFDEHDPVARAERHDSERDHQDDPQNEQAAADACPESLLERLSKRCGVAVPHAAVRPRYRPRRH